MNSTGNRYALAVIFLAFFSSILLCHGCSTHPDKNIYHGTYDLRFSAMRSYENRFKPDITAQHHAALMVTVKKDRDKNHIISFPQCRIVFNTNDNKTSARLATGSHVNTCVLNIGREAGAVPVSFYNGKITYSRMGRLRFTLYGTTPPIEEEGPEGHVEFTFAGAADRGKANIHGQ